MGDGVYRPSRVSRVIDEVLGATKRNLGSGPLSLDPYVIAGQYGVCLNNGEVIARTIIAKLKPDYPGLIVEHKRGQGYVLSLQAKHKPTQDDLKCPKCGVRCESRDVFERHMTDRHGGG